ncbi:methylmalonyl-CoA epimerase [SAR202 cluster bacterium AC-647-N09_OGT_505m]|nr:methylmalonyl-CoA epimerase [SAR202 cluster bacterium AC-647-N09_OGT_505m]
MFQRIDHVGVAVRSLEKAAKKFEDLLGLTVTDWEEVEDQQLIAALVPTMDVRFELMQPTSEDSVVGRFLERRGEGVHHICFEVDDIEAEIEDLKGREVQLIQGAPREGFVGLVEFVHPRAASGVLVEIAQVNRRTSASTDLRLGAVTIAARDVNAAADVWKRNFSMPDKSRPSMEPGGYSRFVRLDTPNSDGLAVIEFAQSDNPQSAIAQFIETRGDGIYSLTLTSQSLSGVPYMGQSPDSTTIASDMLLGVRIVLEQR